nr:hypothetical protein [Tanacetum cinerariifolium]
MVNSCLKKLKFHIASFDMVVKKRTTATTITEGTWGFEHTKACFRDEIIPFVKNLKELFTSFDQCFIDEVTEVQNIFKQMKLAVEQYCADKTKFQTKMESVLQENDRLLTQALSVEIVNIVVHANVKFDCLNVDACAHCVDVAPLVPKLRKNKTAHTDYIRHTQEEVATLRKIVESERLLSPLNPSLAYACKYTRRIQELLMILQQTCPSITDLGTKLVPVIPKTKTKQIRRTAQITKSERTTVAISPSPNIDSNTPVLSSTGVTLVSSANGSNRGGCSGGFGGGGRRVVESAIWDRIDRKTGIIFGFARNARRKSFLAAAGGGGRPEVVVGWGGGAWGGRKGLEVGSIRRIQGIGYGVLGFLGVGTALDIFHNTILLYFQYGVLVFTGYGVLILFLSWSLVSAGMDTPYLP